MTAQTSITATVEMIPGRVAGMVELHNAAGEWRGSSLIDASRMQIRVGPGAPSKAEQLRTFVYENGYSTASHMAAAHGGQLDRYRWL